MDLDIAERKSIVILSHVINVGTTNERLHKQLKTTSDFRSIDWFALKIVDL
jgi:hypothetical protein